MFYPYIFKRDRGALGFNDPWHDQWFTVGGVRKTNYACANRLLGYGVLLGGGRLGHSSVRVGFNGVK